MNTGRRATDPDPLAARVSIRLTGAGRCRARHALSGVHVDTCKPAAFGGSGSGFSSTDLLAAALGTCIATDLDLVARRHGLAPEDLRIEVTKTLSLRPKAVRRLHVVIQLPSDAGLRLRTVCERAVEACLVRRSLAGAIRVSVHVAQAQPG